MSSIKSDINIQARLIALLCSLSRVPTFGVLLSVAMMREDRVDCERGCVVSSEAEFGNEVPFAFSQISQNEKRFRNVAVIVRWLTRGGLRILPEPSPCWLACALFCRWNSHTINVFAPAVPDHKTVTKSLPTQRRQLANTQQCGWIRRVLCHEGTSPQRFQKKKERDIPSLVYCGGSHPLCLSREPP